MSITQLNNLEVVARYEEDIFTILLEQDLQLQKNNKTNHKKYMAEFKKLSDQVVHEATVKMLKDLGIAGSTSTYNIYSAIQEEHRKSKRTDRQIRKELGVDYKD